MKHLLRRLTRSPLFTAMTLITLAVGIGANTAVFSVVHGVLLKPLPFHQPDRLAGLWLTAPGLNLPQLNASASVYFTYREENRVFENLGLWSTGSVTVTGSAEPEEVRCLYVTEGTLPVLGVQPALGRWFSAHDDSPDAPETIMLAYGYWQARFGGDGGVLGRKMVVDGRSREIVGVMPQRFHFMNLNPSVIQSLQLNRSNAYVGGFNYQGLGRLKPGVTVAQANADVARMLPMLPDKFPMAPGLNRKMLVEARLGPDVHPLINDVTGDAGKLLWVLMGTVGIVLFIACANVANLLLVRADGRRRELAIRAALGAGWLRIARELLTESVALGLLGGVLGSGVASAALRVLVALAPPGLPRLEELGIDGPVLLFALAVSVVAGLFFGLIPVLKYVGPQLAAEIHEGGRTAGVGRERHRARSVLVVVQVALALVLLVSSGLMIRTLAAMKRVQPGFQRPSEILTLRISIPKADVAEPERVARMQMDIREKLASVAGVSSVGLVSGVTMDGYQSFDPIYVEGRVYAESQIPPMRRYKYIGPGYFQTMGNPLLAGRDITWKEIFDQRPVVLISENLAREYWDSPAAAIGKRIRENNKGMWREIIGVAGNDRDLGIDKKAPTTVYWPVLVKDLWNQGLSVRRTMAYTIRSSRTGSAGFLKEVQRAIWSVNSNLPLADVRTVEELYVRSMGRTSFALVMLAIAAGMALLLGIVGIYGVISYSVTQRTREIGIRMALGARRQEVTQMFVRHGLALTTAGVACGLAVAAGLMRWMSALLFEVRPIDPATYAAVAMVLIIAAICASYLPAHRAAVIEPIDALRSE